MNEFDQVNFAAVYKGNTLMESVSIKTVPWDVGHPQRVVQKTLANYPKGRLLDVGCGTGENAEFASTEGFAVTAIDLSSDAIQTCRKRHRDSNVIFCQKNIFEIEDSWVDYFDTVLDSAVYHTIPSDDRLLYLKILAGYLHKGGRLLVITFAQTPNGMPKNLAVPKRQLVENLKNAGFSDISIDLGSYCGVYSSIEEFIQKYGLKINKNDAGESLLPVWVASARKM
ncbi:methyltransferase domain-containing protein [Corynebacterium ulcerans]|uniref:class I SAM-dependent methyltransferase n=1 Tax=Corynebacterium ulcerans TaxID=65058 RepID=UPI001303434C|nr:class I SAM-dependent methyltransferase [Corynebacterium ulcerans]MBL4943493.1 class I SAM-dependent methyltransferase [Corynebacterium ulcerans]QGZ24699.1 methyltransferase domain-containing protein [Corynebacterium ulcerans]QOE23412.1 class I SAM-dependent methyltransferase [Corynebacterium ulcerans]